MTAPLEPDHVAEVTQVTDHAARGYALLMRALRGDRPLVAALLRALLRQTQDAEDAMWALLTLTLDTATGAALDQFGELLGERRDPGLSDDVYRDVLRAVILANRSGGTGNELIAIGHLLFGNLFGDFTLEESFPAGVLLEPEFAMRAPDASMRVLRKAKAGGVKLELIDPPAEAAWFTFAVGLSEQADNARGWGDAVDDTLGGRLVEVRV
jgi:hypothetical protein